MTGRSSESRNPFAFDEVDWRTSVEGSHCYHHYPMRFIPQLARALVRSFSRHQQLVLDPFMGSGTVLVEALLLHRNSIGVDVNPIAQLIAEAKTSAWDPIELRDAVRLFICRLDRGARPAEPPADRTERLRWWFPDENIKKLAVILGAVQDLPSDVQPFFRCAFSSILKRCSRWSPHSLKPIRSLKRHRRNILDPIIAIKLQLKTMQDGNNFLWQRLGRRPDVQACPRLGDARSLPLADASVDCIITSPPYVTAYDAVQLSELSLLWLADGSLSDLRRRVIGARVVGDRSRRAEVASEAPWRDAVAALHRRHPPTGVAVARYFADMHASLNEAVRVLRPGGRFAILAGDGVLRGVPLTNATYFTQLLESMGLRQLYRGERPIRDRSLPPWRDAATGRFVSGAQEGARPVYPTEAVLVFEKPAGRRSGERARHV